MRYERRRAELEKRIADPKSDYHGDKKALNDPDEYRSAGAFIVPESARWDNIVKVAQADDIKVQLDNILELLEKKYPDKLRGLLPRLYAGSNLGRENVTGLINLFSKDIFKADHGAEDLLGRVFEFFTDEFAALEGKRGGDVWAVPNSFRRLLVGMIEPEQGVLFDPCCGVGGLFVQSDRFTNHSHQLSFVGQESKDFTYRLCRMNLFIHGIDGNIKLGNSYSDDQHATLRADYVLAAPPFNDGAKSEQGWGADKVPSDDPRLTLGSEKFTLSARNANTMWMLHFLHHLKPGGTAGFVMATGELSNSETNRLEVRKALIEQGYVDCIVQLTGQLFANTQIPCCLWFLSKNRDGSTKGFRKRRDEILFLDGRKLGALIPGSRKQKQLTAEELERMASVYRQYRRKSRPDDVAGFCKVATLAEAREHNYALTPGRYVGAEDLDDNDEPFEDRLPKLVATIKQQFAESAKLEKEIVRNL